jgi:hypothetical protein
MKGTYSQSNNGNFKVIDSIGVPHPYCIGPGHVGYASDHHGGMLGESAIRGAEGRGIYCCTCKGELSYDEHEQALVVECRYDEDELKSNEVAMHELRQYLLGIKKEAESNGYVGFAFINKT